MTYDEFYIQKTFSTGDSVTESNNITFFISKKKKDLPNRIKIEYTRDNQSITKSIDLKLNELHLKNIYFKMNRKNLFGNVYAYKIELENNIIRHILNSKIENIVFHLKINDHIKEIKLDQNELEILNQLI
ncbi:hypothetical protein [Leptospira bouyouniensis]|uniref:hypothetical protein n=1 Tax=Leptospira bouyouniensis TaxID=2484911 RepID=UPI001090CD82|nr:hypothetical protein [Leptospira bouyouniensis]TGM74993.1 hypothetical protein EHQ99_17180 [Leptospira bouyouniensis]